MKEVESDKNYIKNILKIKNNIILEDEFCISNLSSILKNHEKIGDIVDYQNNKIIISLLSNDLMKAYWLFLATKKKYDTSISSLFKCAAFLLKNEDFFKEDLIKINQLTLMLKSASDYTRKLQRIFEKIKHKHQIVYSNIIDNLILSSIESCIDDENKMIYKDYHFKAKELGEVIRGIRTREYQVSFPDPDIFFQSFLEKVDEITKNNLKNEIGKISPYLVSHNKITLYQNRLCKVLDEDFLFKKGEKNKIYEIVETITSFSGFKSQELETIKRNYSNFKNSPEFKIDY